jgi:hypothetical protein
VALKAMPMKTASAVAKAVGAFADCRGGKAERRRHLTAPNRVPEISKNRVKYVFK